MSLMTDIADSGASGAVGNVNEAPLPRTRMASINDAINDVSTGKTESVRSSPRQSESSQTWHSRRDTFTSVIYGVEARRMHPLSDHRGCDSQDTPSSVQSSLMR